MASAIFAFVGVLLGSLTTSVLTIYKDRLAARHETMVRDQQYERDRQAARDDFQRESVQALQTAVSEVIKAAYEELDRVLAEFRESGSWSARRWETPTAQGWSEAVLQLQLSAARVLDGELRGLAHEIQRAAGEAIWAADLTAAKRHSRNLEPLHVRFNDTANRIFASLL
ncbi:hypothetical protein [Streptomyces sp. Caat 7-52]|uniref:hypothetical protein n=1 Tax=Streptomyces sp. Caat 7-52 TaxID=2949637 RepID=UPI0020356D9D|nr:hypothetical protein [Streptomyces sp. Caat 7-52]